MKAKLVNFENFECTSTPLEFIQRNIQTSIVERGLRKL